MSTIEHKVTRGRPCKLSQADKHELRRYREAGVSIARLASMWHLAPTTVHKILAELRTRLGPEELPANKKHLARRHLFISSQNPSTSTDN